MTLHEEIEYYEKALVDFNKGYRHSGDGFCIYFLVCWQVPFSAMDTLYGLFQEYRNTKTTYELYWFPRGEIQPRIEVLEKAISIVKQKIEDEQRISN